MNPLTIDDLGSIQGDILINGFPKKAEIFCFFTIRAAQAFCQNIQKVNIATGKDIKDLRRDISQLADGKIIDVAKTNIAFTSTGLTKLGNFQSTLGNGLKDLKASAPSFFGGMQAPDERKALGDPEFREWNATVGSQNGIGSLDGVLIVAGIKLDTVKAELEKVKSQLNAGGEVIVELGREVGEERHAQPGHEHFGFNDGISHPQVIGINGPNDNKLGFALDKVTQPTDLSNSVDPGIIVVGRKGDKERASSTLSGVNVQPKPTWAKDGSFLVFRKLEQHVDKWNKFVLGNWQGAGSSGPAQFGAQLMGRWQSGCPIHMQSQRDDDSLALRNDFTYGGFQTEGACPFAAHIRKAHIRANLNPSRIMRRGIPYGEDFVNGGADNNRGLLFACYQSTIEDGYRFIQHSWANDPNFPVAGKSGFDVTIGQGAGAPNPFVIGTKSAPINPTNDFVTAKGGEYFFAPSINVLKAGFDLNKLPAQAPQAKL